MGIWSPYRVCGFRMVVVVLLVLVMVVVLVVVCVPLAMRGAIVFGLLSVSPTARHRTMQDKGLHMFLQWLGLGDILLWSIVCACTRVYPAVVIDLSVLAWERCYGWLYWWMQY